MRRSLWERATAPIGLALVIAGLALAGRSTPARATPDAPAGDPPSPLRLVVLETPRGADDEGDPIAADHSDVVALDLLGTSRVAARTVLGSVPRTPAGTARGVVGDDGTPYVVATSEDRDFGATVYTLSGGAARPLASGALRGSLPLLDAPRGRVLFEAGSEGSAGDGEVRVDDLVLRAAPIKGGATHDVYRTKGFATHLAGRHGDVLYVYEVGPLGGAIVTIDLTRDVVLARAPVPAFARDFTVTPRGLVYANRGEDRWTVNLFDGAESPLDRTYAFQPAPFASGDHVFYTQERGDARHLVDHLLAPDPRPAPDALGAPAVGDPTAPGAFEAIDAADLSGRYWLVDRVDAVTAGDALAVVDRRGGKPLPIHAATVLVTPLGFPGGEVRR